MPRTQSTWQSLYQAALATAHDVAGQPRRIACGFTHNVDIVVSVDTEAALVFESIPAQLITGTGQRPPQIEGPADLANTLVYPTRQGVGGEVPTASAEIAKKNTRYGAIVDQNLK